MENKALYRVGQAVDIRDSCFNPASSGWTVPEKAEIMTVLATLKWSVEQLARITGVPERAAENWVNGVEPVPYAVWCIMAYQAGYGEIWKAAESVQVGE